MSRLFLQSARVLVLILALASLPSCLSHHHRVGGGPNGIGSDSVRQFYVFFGLMQINEADHQRLTRNLTSYEIISEVSFTDFLFTAVLWPLTVTSRTVTVQL